MKRTGLPLALVVFLAFPIACKKEASNTKTTAPTSDTFPRNDTAALWKLVPQDAGAALVVAPGALAHLHNGGMRFIKDFANAPGGAKVLDEMRQEASALATALTPDGPKNAGIDLSKGALFYATGPDDVTMVLPVGDRAAFLKATGGAKTGNRDTLDGGETMCDELQGHYVCSTAAGLDAFGKGPSMAPPDGDMRGHIEGVIGRVLLREIPPPMGGFDAMRAAVTLEPGGFTTRFATRGKVPGMLALDGAPRLLADVGSKRPTGVFTLRLKDMWPLLRGQMPPMFTQQPLPGGVTAGDLLGAIDGDVAGYALAGDPAGAIRIGLKDEAPFAKVLAACEGLLPPMLGTAKKDGDKCALTVTPPNSPPVTSVVWIEDKSLRVGFGDLGAKRDAPPTMAMATEFLEKPWRFAAWGYGGFMSPEWKEIMSRPEFRQELSMPELQMGIWFFLHMAELGIAMNTTADGAQALVRLRTSWSNPDAVVDAVEPIIASIAKGDTSGFDKLDAIAKQHPKSPMANDLRAGIGGAAPMAVFGALSAVAIPSFMKYIKKSKTTEARQFVKKIYDGARAHYLDGGAGGGLTPTPASLPKPSAGPTPPLGQCCQGPEGKCMPNAAQWAKEPWISLQFSVDDPHFYSYQYTVADDGKSFTVRALGDLDCDGVYSTFEMLGQVGPDGPMGSAALYRENELE